MALTTSLTLALLRESRSHSLSASCAIAECFAVSNAHSRPANGGNRRDAGDGGAIADAGA
jgi:hypothetical protein